MESKMFVYALAASVAVGVAAVQAQEMGAAPAAAAAVAQPPVAARPVPAGSLATPDDAGPQIVAENQKFAPTVSQPRRSAADANAAVQKALRERGYEQGYNEEKGSIIQIGQAIENADDPTAPDLMLRRELLVRQAELHARMQIAATVRQRMDGSTRVKTPGTDEQKAFMAQYAEQIAAAEQLKAKTAALLQTLEQAEANMLAGVTTDDQWKRLMDGIIRRIDAKYGRDDIVAEKQQQYLKIKAAYEEARAQLDDLKQKQDTMFPRKTVETEIAAYAQFRLAGAVTLVQAESWDGKHLQVAVAVVWSPKLQERALRALGCGEPSAGKASDKTLGAWLQELADSNELAKLVGTRQFVDNWGRQYVLGFSAAEIPDDATDYEDAIMQADLLARQAVAFNLFSEGEGSARVKAGMAKFKGRAAEAAAKVAADMVQELPKDFTVSGLGKLFGQKCRNELSGKDIYVSVAGIDTALAGRSSDILRSWYAAAAQAVATSQYRAGEQRGMEAVYQQVKQSPQAANQGAAAGQNAVIQTFAPAPAAPAAPVVAPVVAPAVQTPAAPGRPKQGVFVTSPNFSDDF
ncbi:MAG: hypothetical protein ACI4Q3_04365 [Kiritimatiellia bacterium]